jgi:hypothetical protein
MLQNETNFGIKGSTSKPVFSKADDLDNSDIPYSILDLKSDVSITAHFPK